LFWVKILNFFDGRGCGSGMEKIRIRGWKNFESGINIQDPQHSGTIIRINKTEVQNPDPNTMVLKRLSSCSENKLRIKKGANEYGTKKP
jgi:hypothetical protein